MWVLNKPIGVDTDMSPGSDLCFLLPPELNRRTFHHVGRLDKETSGLLLFSCDGDLTYQLLNSSRLSKSYIARVSKRPTSDQLARLVEGVILSDGMSRALHAEVSCCCRALYMSPNYQGVFPEDFTVCVVTCEGRNRIVRRMLAAVGLPVYALHRERFGSLSLDDTSIPGECRPLSPAECLALRENC